MHYKKLLEGDFIRAVDFGDRHLTRKIARVQLEKMFSEKKNKDVKKGTVYFEGMERGWVVNVTNSECLAQMFGPDTDGWIGKWVTLGAELVQLGGEMVPGIVVVGSPDLQAPKPVVIKLPKKKPIHKTMQVTKRGDETPPPTGKAAA